MASAPRVNVHPDGPSAAVAAAEAIAVAIAEAQDQRGVASVAVSGGATPAPMFAALADLKVDWSSVHLYQVDERVVADRHRDRNATALVDDLLARISIPRDQVHLMPVVDPDLQAAAKTYARSLPRLDVVHLGLGSDGHTASWPPGDPVIHSPDAVAATGVFNGYERMTLTPRTIDQARLIIWLIGGQDKHRSVSGLLARDDSLPATRALDGRSMLFLDQAAYSGEPPQ